MSESKNIWQGYHGISGETDAQVIVTTGYDLRETYTGGKYHGYPECCILHWLMHYKNEKGDPSLDKYTWNGFIPCPNHRAMVDRGEIEAKDLIKNRLAPSIYRTEGETRMTSAELNLAFAREVAGYPDAKWDHSYDIPVLTSGVDEPVFDGSRVGQRILPDYTKDWNATIEAIRKRGLEWEKNHSSWLPAVGAKKVRVGTFQIRRIPKEKEPSGFWYAVDQEPDWGPCHALCLAAVRCVRAMEAIK